MTTTNDRLTKLKQQQEEIARKIKQEQAKIAEQQRKEDTQRKIIAGALALEHAKRDPEFDNTLQSLFNRFITRNRERALFGLPPLPDQEKPANDAGTRSPPSETMPDQPAAPDQDASSEPPKSPASTDKGLSGLFARR